MAALTCPQGHVTSSPDARFCGTCGARLDATVYPGEPACAMHPQLAAAGTCERCGTFACGECLAASPGGQRWCVACRSRPAQHLPWDRREELGLARAYWQTAMMILRSPRQTFAVTQPDGTLGSSLLFGTISQLLQVSGTFAFYLVLGVGMLVMLASKPEDAPDGRAWAIGAGVVVGVLLLAMAFAVASVLLNAALDHLVLKLVGAKPRSWEVTLRASTLSLAPSLLGLVPLCGIYIAPVWALILRVFAYQAFHRTTGGRAAAGALAVPGFFLLLTIAGYVALLMFSTLLDAR